MKKGSTFHAPVKVIKTRGDRVTVIEVNGQRFVWDNHNGKGDKK